MAERRKQVFMGDILTRARPVCEHEGCECDAPRKVNPINFLFQVLGKMALISLVVFVVLAFIFRVFITR